VSLYWIYDVPLPLLAAGLITLFVLASVGGLLLTRRLVARLVGPPPASNDVVSYYFAAVGVFYGLTVGLIAVATWQAYTTTDGVVGAEAAALAAIYRDVSGYPEPARTELRDLLREYNRYVIEDAWPIQRRGEIPTGGTERITRFQERLHQFEPATLGQQAKHAEALREFNRLVELRRARLQAVTAGLPGPLWWVVVVGAMLTTANGYLFHLSRLRVHVALTAVLAGLMGLLIFLIAAMDNPFRGEVSIGPDAFVIVRDGLMAAD
jgi:hypothetical protein